MKLRPNDDEMPQVNDDRVERGSVDGIHEGHGGSSQVPSIQGRMT